MPTRLTNIVVDAMDPAKLAKFWATALDRPIVVERPDEVAILVNDVPELFLDFVPVAEGKRVKNRVHIDLPSESPKEHAAKVERILGIGAKRIDIGQGNDVAWTVLADPEGNEFCVSPPSDPVPGVGAIGAIAYDAADPALGRFWSEASGWPIVYERGAYVGLRAPQATGPFLTMGPPVHPKPSKNRIHLDVRPFAAHDQSAEVERLISLGARRIDIGQGDVPWVVLADPEGNEFCVLTPL